MQRKIIFILLLILVVLYFIDGLFWIKYFINILILIIGFPFNGIDKYLVKHVPLLFVPIGLGLLGLIKAPYVDVFRDIYYFVIPVISILIGYIVSKRFSLQEIIFMFVLFGFIFSLLHTTISIQKFGFDLSNNSTQIRNEVSSGNSLTIISLFILLFYRKSGIIIPYSRIIGGIIILINLIGFVYFGSRTYLVVVLIFILFLFFIPLSFRRKAIVSVIVLIPIFIIATMIATESIDERNDRGGMTFTTKLVRSFTELETKDYTNPTDIVINFRGFESLMAISSFTESTWMEKIFGQGFGAMVDLGVYVPLGEQEFRFIPILHNGFLYLLIKAGLIGVFFYLLFFFFVFKEISRISSKFYKESTILFLDRLAKSSILSLIAANFVVSSLFNMEFEFLNIFLFIIYFKLVEYKMYGKLI